MGVKFVPGTHLLFSCGKDRLVKCWDGDSFDHIMTLEGHFGEVWCLAVSHDGSTVVTGSHDHSLRLWEKTDEPLILSEEREKEREEQFEEAVAEGGATVVPGEEAESEVAMAGRKTVETMRAAEQLLEALVVYREEKVKGQEWEEECKIERREVPRPKPHPLLVAMGNITAERYVLGVVKKIKSSELEEALLVMPLSEMVDFLPLIDTWIQVSTHLSHTLNHHLPPPLLPGFTTTRLSPTISSSLS
jgi:U3 small nucleolar RNA-associated protein 12